MRNEMSKNTATFLKEVGKYWPLLRNFRQGINHAFSVPSIFEGDWLPEVDIEDKGNSYFVEANMPGINAKDIQVNLDNNTLTISGKISREQDKKEENYICSERSYGEFKRSFFLPEVDQEKEIEAKCKDGILSITIPKKTSNKGRRIEVKGL